MKRHEFKAISPTTARCIHCGTIAYARINDHPGRAGLTVAADVIVFNDNGTPVIPSAVRCVEREAGKP